MKQLEHKPLVLASASPRRKHLLNKMGIDPVIRPARIDERNGFGRPPSVHVCELAREKARTVSLLFDSHWVIGADTLVVRDDCELGKPASKPEAVRMLETLSGSKHSVFTGFCILNRKSDQSHTECVQTDVYFKKLTPAEIDWYTDSREPYDKAGGYGIQGIGAFLVEKISGSYTNVVGLPVCELFQALTRLDLISIR